ncbi:MAG: DNA-directed RNA polymerase subunit omega [Verrucomicrobiales bacterium]
MRSDLVEEASKIIPEPPVLINLISARVKQLNMGRTPLVSTDFRMGAADIALMEIIEGKIGVLDESDEE